MLSLLIIALLFIILDAFWFSYSYKNIYDPAFTLIQGAPTQIRLSGGIFAWFLIALGIKYFVLAENQSITTTGINGAILGFIIYGVYNGTMYAALKNYELQTAAIDTAWGTFAIALISMIAQQIL